MLILFSGSLSAAVWPPEKLHPEIKEVLKNLDEISFPKTKGAKYGEIRWNGLPSDPSPVGFEILSQNKKGFLQFPILSRVLREQPPPWIGEPSIWIFSDTEPPYQGIPSARFAPRSLTRDAAFLKERILDQLALPEEARKDRYLLVSCILFAEVCAENGSMAEAESLVQPISDALEKKRISGLLGIFYEQSANRLFEEAVAFLGRAGNSRLVAAEKFETVYSKYPGNPKSRLAAELAGELRKMVEQQKTDPILSQPEPPPGDERIRWRIAQLQEQTSEGYVHPGGPLFMEGDSPYARVFELRLSAFPALLTLEKDGRLTRVAHPGRVTPWTTGFVTMEEISLILLCGIAGEQFETIAEAREWWEAAQKKGLVLTMSEKIAKGDGWSSRVARSLYDIDPQQTIRSTLDGMANAELPTDAEIMLVELAANLTIAPNPETLELARRALGHRRGSVPWCAAILVMARSGDRVVAIETAKSEWIQTGVKRDPSELRSLIRTLVLTDSVSAIEARWPQLSAAAKGAVLMSVNCMVPPTWSTLERRYIALDKNTRAALLGLLRRAVTDSTAFPPQPRESIAFETYKTVGECAANTLAMFERTGRFSKK